MVTENHLASLIRAAGEEIEVPTSGAQAIRRAASPITAADGDVHGGMVRTTRFPTGRRPLMIAIVSIAALITVLALVIPSGTTARVTASGAIAQPQSANTPTRAANNFALPDDRSTVARGKASAPTSTNANSSKIIATGTLTLRIARNSLDAIVARLTTLTDSNGGYVGRSNVTSDSTNTAGSVVLDIPALAYQSVISAAQRLGTPVKLTTSRNDVTSQYVDVQAHITALDGVRAQLVVLLGRSGKISDLLAVENQIETVQTQIDQLEGQQRLLNSQISYSTLTVNLQVPAKHRTPPVRSGFSRAWAQAIGHFNGGIRWIIAASGALLFALLCSAALSGLAYVLWRFAGPAIRRRRLTT